MTKFETQSCSRCGGSGRFSFNQMHGDRCYGCGGTGNQLTKRGAAAKKFFQELLEKPVSEVQVGDQILTGSGSMGIGPNKWHSIDSIGQDFGVRYGDEDPGSRIKIVYSRAGKVVCSLGGLKPHYRIQSIKNSEDLQQKLAQALSYQDTLLKTGKPSKKKAV